MTPNYAASQKKQGAGSQVRRNSAYCQQNGSFAQEPGRAGGFPGT
jgi:hypothetical protein